MLDKIIPLMTEYENHKKVKQLIEELVDCSERLNQPIFDEIYEFASKIDSLILGRTFELEIMIKIEVLSNRIPRREVVMLGAGSDCKNELMKSEKNAN